ncbi:hypothetical protein BI364_14960 [Acidihalobacter yilgarnensis]|uniref:Cytochrome c-551 n=1 Tax=Acidihalobacter yilgarnensis TaxID=2819280 RepID=A0A1D8IRN6_9GAMM|nr:hypothetical protein [Acidihalobacter yilgarnensis]AOU99067.1 hypothetical protein BI364_14960 [Acidihalobacter yilgarnensis]
MKKTAQSLRLAGLALILAGLSAPVLASPKVNQADATKLLAYVQSNGLACMSCHAVDHRVIGPAWADVALRYHGKSNAEADVSKAIANGSTGLWSGYPPMPPGMASAAQAPVLAKLILHLVD